MLILLSVLVSIAFVLSQITAFKSSKIFRLKQTEFYEQEALFETAKQEIEYIDNEIKSLNEEIKILKQNKTNLQFNLDLIKFEIKLKKYYLNK